MKVFFIFFKPMARKEKRKREKNICLDTFEDNKWRVSVRMGVRTNQELLILNLLFGM
jgi:hypothetical protein